MSIANRTEASKLARDLRNASGLSDFFAAYFSAFNRHDALALRQHYASICRFWTRPGFAVLHGVDAILAFYTALWERAEERIDLLGVSGNWHTAVAEIRTTIVARVPIPDFGTDGLFPGDRLELHSQVEYKFKAGRIKTIRGKHLLARTLQRANSTLPTIA